MAIRKERPWLVKPIAAQELEAARHAVGSSIIVFLYRYILRRSPEEGAIDGQIQGFLHGHRMTDKYIEILASEEFFHAHCQSSDLVFRSQVFAVHGAMPFEGYEFETAADIGTHEGRKAALSGLLEDERFRAIIIRATATAFGVNGRDFRWPAHEQDPILALFGAIISSPRYANTHANFEHPRDAAIGELLDMLESSPKWHSVSQHVRTHVIEEAWNSAANPSALKSLIAGMLAQQPYRDMFLATLPQTSRPGSCEDDDLLILSAIDCHMGFAGENNRWQYRDRIASRNAIADTFLRTLLNEFGPLRNVPTTEASRGYFMSRLALNDAVEFWAAELLVSSFFLGIDLQILSNPEEIQLNVPPGLFVKRVVKSEINELSNNVKETRVATPFFYWYDSINGRDFISSPDNPALASEEHALTVSPPTLVDYSFFVSSYYHKEFSDIAETGIDVICPVYFGNPYSDQSTNYILADNERAKSREFSDIGTRMMRWVLSENGSKYPMKLALFYDTSSLNRNNPKHIHVDLSTKYGQRWFYESIRNFFSHFPPQLWATRNGSPMVLVYHPCFGVRLPNTLYDYVREAFERDFGVRPYIITAAEEEAPRVLRAADIKIYADRLPGEPWSDVLTDFLLSTDVRNNLGSPGSQFVENLYRRIIGEKLSPEKHARLTRFVEQNGEKALLRTLLQSDSFASSVVEDLFWRALRVRPGGYTQGHLQLAEECFAALQTGNWPGVYKAIAMSDAFFEAAGGSEERQIDWIYQAFVMKHPNADCPDGSTTATTMEGREEYLSILAQDGLEKAIENFIGRYEFRESIASYWGFRYGAWWYPGHFDSEFYWSGAIAPVIRDVANIGPGYDQSLIRTRPRSIVQPRRGGERYREVWEWVIAMQPRPWLVHLESWNEMFEGTSICETTEYGRQYIDLTKEYIGKFNSTPTRPLSK